MNDLLAKLGYDLLEKKLSRKIKIFLDVVFVGSVTSFFFERIYFRYQLIKTWNLDSLYHFFISGQFIVPFVMFYIIWHLTKLLGVLSFKLPNLFIWESLQKRIVKFFAEDSPSAQELSDTQRAAVSKFMSLAQSGSLKTLLNALGNAVPKEKRIRLSRGSQIGQVEIENDVVFLIRALIASIFYYATNAYIGWLFLTILILVILLSIFMNFVAYQFAELIQYSVSRIRDKDAPSDEVNQ